MRTKSTNQFYDTHTHVCSLQPAPHTHRVKIEGPDLKVLQPVCDKHARTDDLLSIFVVTPLEIVPGHTVHLQD
jgi:hypothetical protein